MLRPEYTSQFKKDIKTMKKRNAQMSLLKEIIEMLCNEQVIPEKNKDHALIGNWAGYQVGNGVIVFERTGTHSDLF